jgi:hypothetical protein
VFIKRIDASIVFCVIALLSILSVPVIGYIGGRQCCPLIVAILPAEIIPVAVWLLAVIMLVMSVVRSLVIRRYILLRCAALVIVLISTMAFIFFCDLTLFYLYGLRDRFAEQADFSDIHKFAYEVSQKQELVICGYKLSDESKPIWDDLVSRYPFVSWNDNSGTIITRDGLVSLTWGSSLVGHWGFEVLPNGQVKDLENQGKILKVSNDLQFVYFED